MTNLMLKKLLYFIGAISLIVLIGAIQPAMALQGPTQSPPSGVSTTDTETLPPNDPDYGEQWGRALGRTLTFTFGAAQILEYSELRWDPLNSGIAFDEFIDNAGGTVEDLVYDSSPSAGVAEFTGHTKVEVFNGATYGWITVDTRFVLTVTNYLGAPVPFDFDAGLPYVDVLSLPDNLSGDVIFHSNLKMEARNLGDPYVNCNPVTPVNYGPALDVYDCYRTDPGAAEQAITEFIWGFFYELAEPALSMEEHDAHMAELVGGVQDKVDSMSSNVNWFVTDWTLVKPGLLGGQESIGNDIANLGILLDGHEVKLDAVLGNTEVIDGKVNDLANQVAGLNDPLSGIADQIGNLPDMRVLLYLFGIDYTQFGFDPHPNLPPFEDVRPLSALYEAFDAHIDVLSTQLEQKGQVIADLQSQMTAMYTQEQLDQAVANAVAAKDQLISQLITEIASMGQMYTQEQLDQIVADTCPGKSESSQGKK